MPNRTYVSEIMTRDVITIDVQAPMSDVKHILTTHKIHHLPVLDGDELVGIVSASDMLRIGRKIPASSHREMNEVLNATASTEKTMQTDLVTMRADDYIERAIDLLADEERHSVLVVDRDEALAGIVTNIDVLNFLFD